MLALQVAIALLTLIVASVLTLWQGSATISSYHIIFTMGIAPLIVGAIIHFLPVLSRSKSPNKLIASLPFITLLGGSIATSYFVFPQSMTHGHELGASLILLSVACLLLWAYRLKRNTIGRPHPCFDWYLTALLCLFFGLNAILIGYLAPSERAALRLLHLHLNTLGFISITALGTLQVLMPTIAQQADPEVVSRMRKYLPWIIAGTIIIACSAAWLPTLAWVGVPLLAIPLFFTLKAWMPLYAKSIFQMHGAAPLLMAALCGYVMTLLIGTMHAYFPAHFKPVATFIIAFLMPLVTGAVSYLLPIWLHPGKQTTWHQLARKYLGFAGGLRALILMMGGAFVGLNYEFGWYFAAFAISTFIVQLLVLLAQQSTWHTQ